MGIDRILLLLAEPEVQRVFASVVDDLVHSTGSDPF